LNAMRMSQPATGEWVLPLPPAGELLPVTHVHGSLLATSRERLHSVGRLSDYERLLPPPARSLLNGALTTIWLPLEIADDHYSAIDRLGLSEPEITRMADVAAERLSGAFMQTLSSLLRTTGLTPWDIVPFYGKVWRRLFVGGALSIIKEGPKDARITVSAHPLLKHRYHRIALSRHLVIGVQLLVATRAYVRDLGADALAGRGDFLLQWV
jgi:hypothetical protein